MKDSSRQLCTFRIDSMLLGLDVENVQEVIRSHDVTRVSLAPPAVGGLLNLRGQIVTAVDLRTVFCLPNRQSERPPMNVVVRCDDDVVSLHVDEIGDVIEVDAQDFESPPATTLEVPSRALIEGTYKLQRDLLLVLNIRQAVNVSFQDNTLVSV